jgi:hypothetical protein
MAMFAYLDLGATMIYSFDRVRFRLGFLVTIELQ